MGSLPLNNVIINNEWGGKILDRADRDVCKPRRRAKFYRELPILYSSLTLDSSTPVVDYAS